MMMRIVAAGLMLGVVCAQPAAQVLTPTNALHAFFDRFTATWIRSNPNQAAATRFFTGDEQRQFERQLTPLTREYRTERTRLAARGLEELRGFDRARMSDAERVSAGVMDWQLDAIVRADRFDDYYFPFEQFGGVNVGLVNTLTISHSIVTEADAENYVARLGQVAPRLQEALTDARRMAARNLIPPRFIIRTTLEQMRQFVAAPAAANPLVTSFVERMAAATAVPDARRAPLAAAAEKIVTAQVYPAWQQVIALLESIEGKASDEAGLSRFPEGAAAYADALRRFTTTTLSADDIHQIGLREVASLEAEMDGLLRKLGRAEGSVEARIMQLEKDLGYPITDEGRTQILADTESFVRDAEKRSEVLFDNRPKAPIVVRAYPRFREASAAASYSAPAPDGSRPGTFQIPLRPERMTRFGLRTLVYHETVPGHHLQVALELENEALPRFRRLRAFGGISVFSEGWALYAERLAAESGWYDGDIEGRLGQLDDALFRARRLVVDTGLHAKGWTRQQAIDYGIEASEVERYVVNPGQACAYMIGQLKIVELRDKARAALRDRFSPRDFHNVVLGTGTAPLTILEEQVEGFIKRTIG